MTTKLMVQETISKLNDVRRLCEMADELEAFADGLDTDMTVFVKRCDDREYESITGRLYCINARKEFHTGIALKLREYAEKMRKTAREDYERIMNKTNGSDERTYSFRE